MEKNNPDKVDNLNKSFLDEKSYCHYQLVCTGKDESCLLSKNNLKKSKIPITKQFTKKSETLINRCQCYLLPKILSSNLILEMIEDYKGNSKNQEIQKETKKEIIQENQQKKYQDKNNQMTQTEKKNKHFLSALSHQIKTPLNGIVSGLQILQSNQTRSKIELTENTKTTDYSNNDNPEDSILHLMISATNDLSRYVNDIIDYYLLEKDELQLEYQPINMRLIVSKIKDMFQEQLDSNKILFHTSYPDYIPPQEKIDTKRFLQIIYNLMTNSIKDTYKGIISLEIGYYPQLEEESTSQGLENYNLGFPLKNNYLLICISDTGTGIPEKDKASIFDPFFQVSEKWMTQQEGLGLGLTICKKLVEKMNGSIELIQNKYDNKSIYQHFMNSHFKINKGCSLLLAIPLVKDNNINNTNNNTNNNNTDLSLVNNKYHHGQEIDPTPTTHENLDDIKIIVSSYKEKTDEINGLNKETEQTNSEILQQINNKTIKILIVEDNQINSKLLKMMITKIIETETTTIQNSDHYEIEVVNNPDEALSTITNNNFDIIFLDLKMPRISGFDILQQLQNLVNEDQLAKMPTICVTTALIQEEIEKQLLNYENVSFLYKPIQIDQLKKKVLKVIKLI